MTTVTCCVPGCTHKRGDAVLHIFPNPNNDLEKFKKWTLFAGENVTCLDDSTVHQRYRMCHCHFEPKYHSVKGRLTRNAVPSLFLADQCRQPLQDITNSRELINLQVPELCFLENISLTSENENMSRPCQQQTLPIPKRPKKGYVSIEVAKLNNKIKKLENTKLSIQAQLKRALKLTENPSFQKMLQYLSPTAKKFTNMQFREAKKHKQGRRFKKSEKLMALSLYKQGPKAYRWLRQFFTLPSPITLSRMITKASLRPGVNENLFGELQKRASKMSMNEKLCVLLFDEMALTPHFDYKRREDIICGFVNNGENITENIADHVLVFMIRGIQKNYKQPISYSFCSGTTSKFDLVKQLKNIILKLFDIGFLVIGTICDQGSTNVSAINYLVNETRRNYLRNGEEINKFVFEINGKQIVPLYDPPHLIKGIRNNLLTKNLIAVINNESKIAKWGNILEFYKKTPTYQGLRLVPKITENHVMPQKIRKMKVKYATQIFSQTE